MQAIQAPIKPGESGPPVANLQDALRLLLERGVIRSLESPNSPTAEELAKLAQLLTDERAQPVYGEATQRLTQIVQIQQGLGDNLGGVVEDGTADVLNRLLRELGALGETGADEFVVRGRVTLVSGRPAPGLIVRASDRDLRRFQALGEADDTDSDGRYEIPYSRGEFSRAEKGNADLVIRVFSPDSASDRDRPLVESPTLFNAPVAEIELVESPTLFNAPAVAEIDLQVPDTGIKRSEFERHVEAIEPLLAGQAEDGGDLPIVALTERDIDFLASDTSIERQHVAWLSTAFAHSTRTTSVCIATHVSSVDRQVPAALFYG